MAVKDKPKVTVSYAHCSIFVQGTEMTCPLCGFIVKDGERHECMQPEEKAQETVVAPERGPRTKGRK